MAKLRDGSGRLLCEHGRRRSRCKDCGGGEICEHGMERGHCKDCGGSQICEHGRQRSRCKDCGGSEICEHGRRRGRCPFCCPVGAVKRYRSSAARRGRSWSLTDEQAMYLFAQPCAYCGVSPSGGIDRRKNEYGYTVSNSLPCCSSCNFGKRTLTAKAFIEECHKVSNYCVDRETFVRRNAELQEHLRKFEEWRDSDAAEGIQVPDLQTEA